MALRHIGSVCIDILLVWAIRVNRTEVLGQPVMATSVLARKCRSDLDV